MASYFDEHDCEPLGENERPNDLLQLARLLIDSGMASALNLDYDSISGRPSTGHSLPPPVSKIWLSTEFPKYVFNESEKPGHTCPICLLKFVDKDESDETNLGVRLPKCGHVFHKACLEKWLEHTNSCPMCRFEFPTDDPNYEEFKRQKKREKAREQDLATLHDSMFS
jgi:hypothetical protein